MTEPEEDECCEEYSMCSLCYQLTAVGKAEYCEQCLEEMDEWEDEPG